ncbi:MAG TPA: FTR1 family protein [Ktedonobacterales bacterium]|nr:FTR1 family protein [Ktedonobacterales bacterium]
MLPTFVLFLREGLEASLVVSILFATLRQLGQLRQMRAVWMGVALAVLGSLGGAAVIFFTVRQYDDTRGQMIFETVTYLVAVVLLTYMTFWMQRHSRTLKKEIAAKAGMAGSGFAFGLLAFTTVGREGLESAVFTLAFAFQTDGALLILGGLLGIAAAILLCVMIYRLGYRLDYRIFFRVMGILLLFFAAGLLGNAIQNVQELGWLNLGTVQLWNTSHILSQASPLGDLMHGLMGYSEAPTLLQAFGYVAYLAVAGALFWRLTRKPPQALQQASGSTPASSTVATEPA